MIKKKKTITLGYTYNESREFLACTNMDRELRRIRGPNNQGE
jgi:hypothetical protein